MNVDDREPLRVSDGRSALGSGGVEDGGSVVGMPPEILEPLLSVVSDVRAHPQSPWLTVREAEKYARVGHGVISKAIKDGELPAYQRCTGSATLVDVKEVDRWIRNTWKIEYVDGKPRRTG